MSLSYLHYDGLTVAFLSSVWTRLPAAARANVAAAMLAVAFAALTVGAGVRQARVRPFSWRSPVRAAEPVDTLWSAAHFLDGSPSAVGAALKVSAAPSLDRLCAAWLWPTAPAGQAPNGWKENCLFPSALCVSSARSPKPDVQDQRNQRNGNVATAAWAAPSRTRQIDAR